MNKFIALDLLKQEYTRLLHEKVEYEATREDATIRIDQIDDEMRSMLKTYISLACPAKEGDVIEDVDGKRMYVISVQLAGFMEWALVVSKNKSSEPFMAERMLTLDRWVKEGWKVIPTQESNKNETDQNGCPHCGTTL